ncbi:MAG: DUF222 domain-containing protein [Propionibacteriaceae bacterium]
MNAGGSVDETPVGGALTALSTDLDRLITAVESGGLDHYDDRELLEFIQSFERFRNRLSLVDHRIIADADRRRLASHFTYSTLSALLVSALRISPAEASRRTRAAAAVGERVSQLGEVLEPVRPMLAAAQREGTVSPEQVSIVERALDDIDRPGIDPAEVTAAEETLVGNAVSFGPRDLRKVAVHLVDAIHPDGTVPDDEMIADRRDLHLSALNDGSYRCEGRLTPSVASLLKTVCTPLAKPRPTTVTGPNGGTVEVPDPRNHGQRMHDALEEALGRLLNLGDRPATGGTPTTLIVTIGYEDLMNRTGHGESSDGTLIPVQDVLRLADQADIFPAVLTGTGALLNLGRSRRIASHAQTLALIARDGGCSFPGCSHPPEYCDRHHIKEWIKGGFTDLDNLTLLCRYHHTRFAQHGWTCALNSDGIVEWTPPRWIDATQTPQVNHRIRRRIQERASKSSTGFGNAPAASKVTGTPTAAAGDAAAEIQAPNRVPIPNEAQTSTEAQRFEAQAPTEAQTPAAVEKIWPIQPLVLVPAPAEHAPRIRISHAGARAPSRRREPSDSAMEAWLSTLSEFAPT